AAVHCGMNAPRKRELARPPELALRVLSIEIPGAVKAGHRQAGEGAKLRRALGLALQRRTQDGLLPALPPRREPVPPGLIHATPPAPCAPLLSARVPLETGPRPPHTKPRRRSVPVDPC